MYTSVQMRRVMLAIIMILVISPGALGAERKASGKIYLKSPLLENKTLKISDREMKFYFFGEEYGPVYVIINSVSGRSVQDIRVMSIQLLDQIETFDFQDINFDGYEDLKIFTGASSRNGYFNYYIYNSSSGTFDDLVQLSNPEINRSEREVSEYESFGHCDYRRRVYKAVDGRLKLILKEKQKSCDKPPVVEKFN